MYFKKAYKYSFCVILFMYIVHIKLYSENRVVYSLDNACGRENELELVPTWDYFWFNLNLFVRILVKL